MSTVCSDILGCQLELNHKINSKSFYNVTLTACLLLISRIVNDGLERGAKQ